jgi:site-specific recombinase XerD
MPDCATIHGGGDPMNKPKLLDQVRDRIRVKHYSYKTEKTYIHWIKSFILFHNKRHPADMAEQEVEQFLNYLAIERNVSASTQNQAFAAILFLYREIIERELKNVQLEFIELFHKFYMEVDCV